MEYAKMMLLVFKSRTLSLSALGKGFCLKFTRKNCMFLGKNCDSFCKTHNFLHKFCLFNKNLQAFTMCLDKKYLRKGEGKEGIFDNLLFIYLN